MSECLYDESKYHECTPAILDLSFGLLAVAMLPLAGCDSAGSNGVGDDGEETGELDAPDDFDAEVQSGTIELS